MSKDEIERQATELRMRVEEGRKRRIKPNDVAEAIADSLEISIVWQGIPDDGKGMVAAMILPVQNEIIINEYILELELKEEQKDGFRQSTIAHEIGHWMLHINHHARDKYIERFNQGFEPIVKPFFCRSVTSSQGMEWQAQYFAGCLLMPKSKLEEALNGRDLTNWKHLYAMTDEFGVTISNLIYRLEKDLGWIDIPKYSRQIYLGQAAPNKLGK